jgi:hypothetical protein
VKARSRYRKRDDDVGGVKANDDFGEGKLILARSRYRHRASDTGRAIPASRPQYQNRTLEPPGVGILNTGTGPTKRPPGITDTDPKFGLILGATKRSLIDSLLVT